MHDLPYCYTTMLLPPNSHSQCYVLKCNFSYFVLYTYIVCFSMEEKTGEPMQLYISANTTSMNYLLLFLLLLSSTTSLLVFL